MPESNGHWPTTVAGAVRVLLSFLTKRDKLALQRLKEKDLAVVHIGVGMFIREEFGLWEGNRALLKACGSTSMHPEDASMVIMKALWKRVRKKK